MKSESFPAEYEDSEKYYDLISDKVKEFISSIEVDDADKKILGIGFALQGLT